MPKIKRRRGIQRCTKRSKKAPKTTLEVERAEDGRWAEATEVQHCTVVEGTPHRLSAAVALLALHQEPRIARTETAVAACPHSSERPQQAFTVSPLCEADMAIRPSPRRPVSKMLGKEVCEVMASPLHTITVSPLVGGKAADCGHEQKATPKCRRALILCNSDSCQLSPVECEEALAQAVDRGHGLNDTPKSRPAAQLQNLERNSDSHQLSPVECEEALAQAVDRGHGLNDTPKSRPAAQLQNLERNSDSHQLSPAECGEALAQAVNCGHGLNYTPKSRPAAELQNLVQNSDSHQLSPAECEEALAQRAAVNRRRRSLVNQKGMADSSLTIEQNGPFTCCCGVRNEVKVPQRSVLNYTDVLKKGPKEFRRMTGLLPTSFTALYNFIGGHEVCSKLKYQYASTPRKKQSLSENTLSLMDRLFLTLVRLRRGLAVEDLAFLFNISKSHVSDIFYTWIQLIYLQFLRIKEEMFTTKGTQPKSILPACLKEYKNYRVTIDTTEVRVQVPYNYKQQGNCYSSYKSGCVINFLVGNNCWGSASYISPGFEGSMSDVEIFEKCGIMEMLHPGDLILADRGFTVEHLLDPLQVKLVHPPFLKKRDRLSPEDEMSTKSIAAGRIHVERLIRKIKCFLLLKRMTNNMLPLVNQCFYVAACLVNFDPPNL